MAENTKVMTESMLLDNWGVTTNCRTKIEEATNKKIAEELATLGECKLTDKNAETLSNGKCKSAKEYTAMIRSEYESEEKRKLYKLLQMITGSTKIMDCQTNNIAIYTINALSEDGSTVEAWFHNVLKNKTAQFPVTVLKEKYGLTDSLLDEALKESLMFIQIGDDFFATTHNVLQTLTQRAGSGMGDFATRKETSIRFYRNAGYVHYMAFVPTPCKALYRQAGKVKKLFATFSDRYRMIEQYPLVKTLIDYFEKEMGHSELTSYSVTNYMTEIFLEFPEKADDFSNTYGLPERVIPGIRICMSDVGESSVFVCGTTKLGRGMFYMPHADFKKPHTKNTSEESILEDVTKKVFSGFTKAPERLLELLKIDIDKPMEVIEDVVEHCHFTGVMGKKMTRNFTSTLEGMVNMTMPHTAYDIASLFLDIEADMEKSSKSKTTASDLREAFSSVIFYDYEKHAKKSRKRPAA